MIENFSCLGRWKFRYLYVEQKASFDSSLWLLVSRLYSAFFSNYCQAPSNHVSMFLLESPQKIQEFTIFQIEEDSFLKLKGFSFVIIIELKQINITIERAQCLFEQII